MHKKDPFSRDASGRLCVDLDLEYPGRSVDFDHVRAVLKKQFAVVWGETVEDALGDACWWDFTWEGETFQLHWHFMMGLCLTACHSTGEERLREMAAYFEANPRKFLRRWW